MLFTLYLPVILNNTGCNLFRVTEFIERLNLNS